MLNYSKINFVSDNNKIQDIINLSPFLKFFRNLSHLNISRINSSNNKTALYIFLGNICFLNNLTYLCLNHNYLDKDAVSYLSFSLKNLSNLIILLLRNNCICDEGVMLIINCFEKMVYLKELDLGQNKITNIGADNLAKNIMKLKTIKNLILDKNNISLDILNCLNSRIKFNIK